MFVTWVLSRLSQAGPKAWKLEWLMDRKLQMCTQAESLLATVCSLRGLRKNMSKPNRHLVWACILNNYRSLYCPFNPPNQGLKKQIRASKSAVFSFFFFFKEEGNNRSKFRRCRRHQQFLVTQMSRVWVWYYPHDDCHWFPVCLHERRVTSCHTTADCWSCLSCQFPSLARCLVWSSQATSAYTAGRLYQCCFCNQTSGSRPAPGLRTEIGPNLSFTVLIEKQHLKKVAAFV